MNHLLSIEELDRAEIERILAQAARFAEVSDREIKKVPALRGRMVLNLFYEASTRTRSSFELAAKRLSADVVNFAASGSSVEKGESLKDTVLTLSAHKPDAIVLRTPWAGASELVSKWCGAAIVNAGDGIRRRRCSTSTRCSSAAVGSTARRSGSSATWLIQGSLARISSRFSGWARG
jgi:aspartate carbamoyltransferase catalytic subunit